MQLGLAEKCNFTGDWADFPVAKDAFLLMYTLPDQKQTCENRFSKVAMQSLHFFNWENTIARRKTTYSTVFHGLELLVNGHILWYGEVDLFYLKIVLRASFQACSKDFFLKYFLAYASEASLSCLVPSVCRYFLWLVEV